jgi:hypothetical protein
VKENPGFVHNVTRRSVVRKSTHIIAGKNITTAMGGTVHLVQ